MAVGTMDAKEIVAMQKTTLVLEPLPANDVPPPPPAPTNEALIAKIVEGDGNALWMLHTRHAKLIRDVIARVLGEGEECDELVREVFEDIRDRAVHYTAEKGRALGWIVTVARRRAQNCARRSPEARPRLSAPRIALQAIGELTQVEPPLQAAA
jgi:RNA polymerase sigma-70 factor (ECF subfamily)